MIKIIAIIFLATGSALVVCGVLIFILSDLRSVLKDLSTTRKLEVDSGIDDAVQEAYYSESYAPDVAEEKLKMKGFIRRKSAQSSETGMLGSSDEDRIEKPQGKRRAQAGDTQPLETLREILSETAPLSTAGKSGTQPLYSGQPVSETQPLYQKPASDTQPLGRAQEAAEQFARARCTRHRRCGGGGAFCALERKRGKNTRRIPSGIFEKRRHTRKSAPHGGQFIVGDKRNAQNTGITRTSADCCAKSRTHGTRVGTARGGYCCLPQNRGIRRGTVTKLRCGFDPLQRRAACHGQIRYGARARVCCKGTGAYYESLCRRNPSAFTGRAADGI